MLNKSKSNLLEKAVFLVDSQTAIFNVTSNGDTECLIIINGLNLNHVAG